MSHRKLEYPFALSSLRNLCCTWVSVLLSLNLTIEPLESGKHCMQFLRFKGNLLTYAFLESVAS